MATSVFCCSFKKRLLSAVLLPAVLIGLTGLATSDEVDRLRPLGEVEEVCGGFAFTEGPAWDSNGTLLFSDIPNNKIHSIGADEKLNVFSKASNHTNGIMVAADGRILACEMDGQVVSYDPTSKKKSVLASKFDGKRFNAPNDLVIDTAGGIYFTDPLFRAPKPLPQTIQAVYYISADGDVSRVTEGIAAPNGVGLSPDGKTLYVIPSQQEEMLAYDVKSPGKLSNQRVICKVKQPEGRSGTGGDGMAVDVKGNIYLTTHLGVEVFTGDGKPITLIEFPQQPANVAFGGADGKTMYVTARTALYRVQMPIAGLKPN